MGWAFYELSGGADFVPPSQRDGGEQVAAASAATDADTASRSATSPATADLTFARASTQGQVATAKPAVAKTRSQPKPQPASVNAPDIGEGTLEVRAIEMPEPQQAAAPAIKLGHDVRKVNADYVNMRAGPGTQHDVLTQLREGDRVEVLEDSGNGWVQLRETGTGREGWVADFLLTRGS